MTTLTHVIAAIQNSFFSRVIADKQKDNEQWKNGLRQILSIFLHDLRTEVKKLVTKTTLATCRTQARNKKVFYSNGVAFWNCSWDSAAFC